MVDISFNDFKSGLGEGGHGYLKDRLWWGGLLTSKTVRMTYRV